MPEKFIDLPKKILRLFTRSFRSRTVSCKMFNDTVTDQICRIRKQELHSRGSFSCSGCKEQ